MDWYYAEDGQQKGPVNDADFQQLVSMGRIKNTTLVWKSGMSDWKPYGEVVGLAPSGGVTTPASSYGQPGSGAGYGSGMDYGISQGGGAQQPGGYGAPQYGGTPLQQTGTVFCSQCGRPHQAEDMVELFNQAVCPSCKPYFLQRMQEGTMNYNAMAGIREYGGFWIRFAAKFIDGIILMFINLIFQIPFFLFNLSQSSSSGGNAIENMMTSSSPVLNLFSNMIGTIVGCAYTTFFIGKYAATPGKMACGLRVIVADGSQVSYMRAFGRYWAEVLSYCTCTIGYIIAAFDDEKRALHDHICTTRVIKVK